MLLLPAVLYHITRDFCLYANLQSFELFQDVRSRHPVIYNPVKPFILWGTFFPVKSVLPGQVS